MVYDTARTLAAELKNSEEYHAFKQLRERAMQNETTKNLIGEYHRLQMQVQASAVQGKTDQDLMQKLQKIGEVLQFDADASAFLMAEYRMNRLLADVYKILAEAVDVDLSMLENE